MVFQVAFSLVSLAILGVVAWRLYVAYQSSAGTLWQRLLAAGHGSATMLWQYAVMGSAAFLGNIEKIANGLNLPEVQTFINAHVPPQELAVVMIVISVVTIVARLRTL